MNLEKLLKQLLEISEVVNSFESETIQVAIIERLLDAFELHEYKQLNKQKPGPKPKVEDIPKSPGSARILNKIYRTDFLNVGRSISEIAIHCKEKYNSDFETPALSGTLLRLIKKNKLQRFRGGKSDRYLYLKLETPVLPKD